MQTNNNSPLTAPYEEGEVKNIIIGLRETDGQIQILLESEGLNDDIKNIALTLDYALENMVL